ncbi:MAG: hypothetical protein WC967_11515 [Balneolaceae bacterium]
MLHSEDLYQLKNHFDQKDLIFYPGSGIDIQPLLLRAFGIGDDHKRHFVYCDNDESVISFYRNLINIPNEVSEWKKLNPQYSSFFDSHNLTSIKIHSFTDNKDSKLPHISFELELSSNNKSFVSKLDFFGTTIESYLDTYHPKYFADRKIKCVLYIKQQHKEVGGRDNFFAKSTFNKHLNNPNLLKNTSFVICDTQELLGDKNWQPYPSPTQSSLPGWGVAGNSLVTSKSAVIYERVTGNTEKQSQPSETEELKPILKLLSNLKFSV